MEKVSKKASEKQKVDERKEESDGDKRKIDLLSAGLFFLHFFDVLEWVKLY